MKPWRYADEDRPKGVCYDCGRPYGDEHGFPDLLVPNDVWEKINPTEHRGAGLLCPSCIVARCVHLGLERVPVVWTSGPFAPKSDPFHLDRINREWAAASPPDSAVSPPSKLGEVVG